ncbi:MAG: nucleotidyltransferase domain-containing protein [bacterium]
MEKRLLEDIVDKIVAGVSPEKVILFGSHAYGDANEDSDIDLLVVWETPLVGAERIRHISRLLAPRPAPIDIVVRTPAEIQRAASRVEPFLTEILSKGVVAYERR